MRASTACSRRRRFAAAIRVMHLMLALALLIGLVAPFVVPAPGAFAAQPGGPLPPPLPAPNRVALAGSFQTALGCPADFDASCPQTQLSNNRDGSWSTILPIPAGDYVFRVVASSDADRALGQGGRPDGPDIPLSVPPDAAGVYFRYDSLTGEIEAAPVASAVQLVTDFGEQFAMAPVPGGYEVTWDAQPGNYGFEIRVNGQPVTRDAVSLDVPSRVIVAVDEGGAVTVKDTLRDTRVSVQAVDASGAPRPGSCFAIVDRQGQLRAQACDTDDAQPDGIVALRVPNGLADGDYSLLETFTAAGEAASEQQIALGAGQFDATAAVAGEPAAQPATEEPAVDEPPAEEPATQEPATEEPPIDEPTIDEPVEEPATERGERPGELWVVAVDEGGERIPGACFAIVELGFEQCDDDGDGITILTSVPSAPLTLRQTVTPTGFAPAADLPITIDPTGARIRVAHQPAGEESSPPPAESPIAPAETPQPSIPGEVRLSLRDAEGNPVTGACWMLIDVASGQALERCDDEDGADDGFLLFESVPEGQYALEETVTPPDHQPVKGPRITVAPGVPADAAIEYQRAAAGPGRLVIDVVDPDGAAVPETCFDLRGPIELIAVCDEQNDGRLNIPELPAGDYIVTQTQTAEGFTPAAETTVEVPAGESVLLPLVNSPTGEPQTAGDGRVVVTVQAAGTPVAGACVTLDDGIADIAACDDDADDESSEPGRIEFAFIPAGSYTVRVTAPAGYNAPDPTTVDVRADEAATVAIELQSEAPLTSTLSLFAEDDTGARLPGACYMLEVPPGGETYGPFCDEDGDGTVTIQGIPAGNLAAIESTPPDGVAPAESTRQELTVADGQPAEIVFTRAASREQEAPGTLRVQISDAAGQPLAGCVEIADDAESLAVCDNDAEDFDPSPGVVQLDELPPATYSVSVSNLPAGFADPDPQTVEVLTGETANLAFSVAALPGTLVILVADESGQPLGGSCFTLVSEQITLSDVCDQGDDGRLNFPDLPAGRYSVTQTRSTEGFQPAPPSEIVLDPGQTLEVALVNTALPTPTPEPTATASPTMTPEPSPTAEPTATPEATVVTEPTATPAAPATAEPQAGETGVVEFAAVDDDGAPVAGQCYSLVGPAGTFGPFCDNGEGDTSDEPGVLRIEGLPVGSFEAVLESDEVAPDAEIAQEARPRRSVSVRRGNRPTRVRFNVRGQRAQRGDLLIRVQDPDGNYLAGACFTLTANGESQPAAEVCDNARGDANSANGRILLTRLRPGRYSLVQTAAANGYLVAAQRNVRVAARDVREVSVTNRVERDRTGSLTIETVDSAGTRLGRACYSLQRGTATVEACDEDGDGVTSFADLEPASYIVRQTRPPAGGFAMASNTAVRILAGESVNITVENEPQPGSLVIRKTDQAGQLLGGACFALLSGDDVAYRLCDDDASDGDRQPGVLHLGAVAPGTYTLRETQAPVEFVPVADREITINAAQRTDVTVANMPAPPPPRVGNVRVFKVDAAGQALGGACFTLIDAAGRQIVPRCDADDGSDDGVIVLSNIAVGSYTLRETRRPSADFQTAADVAVTVNENQTLDIEVVNQLRRGRVLIRKFDPNGVPLAGACFDLREDASGPGCTDEAGELLFANLVPGVYTLVETEAPEGFQEIAAIDPITVRPGRTTTVDVVDEPLPPPPDSGSIQVRKFVCPVEPGGGGIVFVDSSNPDGGGLARTAGCDRGDTSFLLDGPGGPLSFRTGASGRYQTTLPTGDYILTELGTGAAEPVTISLNTLTTVVVINYVEPAPPAPAAIEVMKYTCAAGFQGSVWLDFAEACLSDETLTNNVGFRLIGPVTGRRVTGDTGRGGTTRFDALVAGDYRLREETPAGVVAVYAFCGLDPSNPDGRVVGSAVDLRIAAGETITCHWFNVPEDLTSETGAITVYKYACPITTPPANFDWFGRCDPPARPVNFTLSVWDGAAFQPLVTAGTDADGILRFTRLQPGIYDLTEVDGRWCHAESDSVDAQGHVVVSAGKRASVWIFNCVGAKQPPNTGAGPMWTTGAGIPASADGLGFMRPLAGPAAFRMWRHAA